MPAAQRFDQSMKPSRATRAAAATIAAVGVTLLGVAVTMPVTTGPEAGAGTVTQNGGFKGMS